MTKNQASVLHGLTCYPTYTDSALADALSLKLSTLTSIKRRLFDSGLYRTIAVPAVNRLGCELLAVIHTQFNPVMPLEERVKTTRRSIEVFDELVLSLGEQEKGFSLNLSQNYTNIGRISDVRTEIFGRVGLIDKSYPREIVFPFATSSVYRFFDYSRLLQAAFALDPLEQPTQEPWFSGTEPVILSATERRVLVALVQHPTATTQELGDGLGVSRHTVARLKQSFLSSGLLRPIVLPALDRLGFQLLTLSHIAFNPHRAPTATDCEALDTPSTVFYVGRKFEAVVLSAYPSYQEFKEDEMQTLRYLREHDLIVAPPLTETYSYDRLAVIKDFDFAAITKKILAEPGVSQKENGKRPAKNT